MMEDKLENLIRINGVEGIFIYNNKAETMYHLLKRTLEERLIEEIGRHLIQIFAFNKKSVVKDIQGIEIIFDKGSLICYNSDYYTFVIWLNKNAQISLIRLNIDLIISGLKSDSGFQKLLKKNKIDFDYLLRKEFLDEHEESILNQLKK